MFNSGLRFFENAVLQLNCSCRPSIAIVVFVKAQAGDQMEQIGIVSFGVGCAQANAPGKKRISRNV